MARYTGPKTRINRKFKEPILGPDKWMERKPYQPGQHGAPYQLRAEGQTPKQAQAWFDERLLVPRADLETWPGEPTSSCACWA